MSLIYSGPQRDKDVVYCHTLYRVGTECTAVPQTTGATRTAHPEKSVFVGKINDVVISGARI